MKKNKITTHSGNSHTSQHKGQKHKSNHSPTRTKTTYHQKSDSTYKSDELNDKERNWPEDDYDKEYETGYDEELDDVYGREYKTASKSRVGKSFVLNSNNSIHKNSNGTINKVSLTRNPVNKKNNQNESILKARKKRSE